MSYILLNIGLGNSVLADEVIAILAPNSSPMKRLREEAKDEKRLLDATHGRKTRSIIVLKTNHIVLSATQADTISQRFKVLNEEENS